MNYVVARYASISAMIGRSTSSSDRQRRSIWRDGERRLITMHCACRTPGWVAVHQRTNDCVVRSLLRLHRWTLLDLPEHVYLVEREIENTGLFCVRASQAAVCSSYFMAIAVGFQ